MSIPHDAAASGVLDALRARVGCEIRTDRLSRVLYSSDASNHQIQPLGVAFPRDLPELSHIIAAAADLGLPVLPREQGPAWPVRPSARRSSWTSPGTFGESRSRSPARA